MHLNWNNVNMAEESPKPLVIRNKDISYTHCQHSLSSGLPFFCPSGCLSLMYSSERETAHIKPAYNVGFLPPGVVLQKEQMIFNHFPIFPSTKVLLGAELVSTCRYIPSFPQFHCNIYAWCLQALHYIHYLKCNTFFGS